MKRRFMSEIYRIQLIVVKVKVIFSLKENFWNELIVFSQEWLCVSVSQSFVLPDPIWLRKITTDPHILAYLNIECPDDRYSKLKFHVSGPIEIAMNTHQ